LLQQLERAAKKDHRSLNEEIARRLEQSLAKEATKEVQTALIQETVMSTVASLGPFQVVGGADGAFRLVDAAVGSPRKEGDKS
jgi:transcriptional regulator NrdR family protein